MKTPTKPQKKPLIKICTSCDKKGPHNWMNTNKTYRYRCQSCHNEYNRRYRQTEKYKKMHSRNEAAKRKPRKQKIKRYLIKLLGGKCQICGLDNDCPAIYDFHHRDPNKKDLNISSADRLNKSLLNEVKKCDLLCSNCHRQLHWLLSQ